MRINADLCKGCKRCLLYCPMQAISSSADRIIIDEDECVDCYACVRAGCPVDALEPSLEEWPRSIRRALSDPITVDEKTAVSGRGTAEIKTNDLTGRFKPGQVGVGIELGRPVLGTRFKDVQKVTRAFARLGAYFEPKNPVTTLMTDNASGDINPDILNEKVMSAIVEAAFPLERLGDVLEALEQLSGEVETVFSVVLASKTEKQGPFPFNQILEQKNREMLPNGKVNVGLGRPLYEGEDD